MGRLINLRRNRPRVARIDLTPGSRGAASSGEKQEEARRRRQAWMPVLVLVVLIGVAVGYFLFMANHRRGTLDPDASQPIVAHGGRFAQRFADLLARSSVAAWWLKGHRSDPVTADDGTRSNRW